LYSFIKFSFNNNIFGLSGTVIKADLSVPGSFHLVDKVNSVHSNLNSNLYSLPAYSQSHSILIVFSLVKSHLIESIASNISFSFFFSISSLLLISFSILDSSFKFSTTFFSSLIFVIGLSITSKYSTNISELDNLLASDILVKYSSDNFKVEVKSETLPKFKLLQSSSDIL